MSFRAFWNSLKEGVQGIIRHPLVTVASTATMCVPSFAQMKIAFACSSSSQMKPSSL